MNAFFKSQFVYCSLSWTFHSRTLNNMINRLHERCLRLIYSDNASSFTALLEINTSVSVHHRDIQVLVTELYKFVHGLSPKLVRDCFKLNNMKQVHFLFSASSHSLTWRGITFPLGTENLGSCAK